MSPEERLEAAVRALRATPEASEEMASETERRVLAAVAGQSTPLARRRRPMLVTAAVLALLGSTALAAAKAGFLEVPRWLGDMLGAPASRPHPVAPSPVRSAEPPPAPTAIEPAPAVEVAEALDAVPPPLPAVPPPAPPRPARPAAKRLEAKSVAVVPASVADPPAGSEPSPAPVPAPVTPDEIYARGHRAHFVEQNPRAALEAWDAYLRVVPDGRFAPEARFNRAIDLVRLGRTGEAAEALEALAHGDYRAADAARLLDAVRRGAIRTR